MTDTTDHPPARCPVCDPGLRKPWDEIVAERCKEIAEVLHVVRCGDGYHVLQIPGDDGAPCTSWPGPFDSEAAASLFRDDLISAAAEGEPGNACCSNGIFEYFNIAGRILDIIEGNEGDTRALARKITSEEPWKPEPAGQVHHQDLPF